MMRPPPSGTTTPRRKRRIPLWGHALLSLAVAFVLLWGAPLTALHPKARLPDMVAGTAAQPMVRRALVPAMIRVAAAATPDRWKSVIEQWTMNHPTVRKRLGLHAGFAVIGISLLLLEAIALFVFAVLMVRLFESCFAAEMRHAVVAAAAACAGIPIHLGYSNFVYDFATLCSFTLGLQLILRANWFAYYALLPLGLINKETFCLLTAAFFVRERSRLSRGRMMAHVIAQSTITGVVYVMLLHHFRGNPGSIAEWHFDDNLKMPVRLHDVLYWGLWVYAFMWYREKRELAAMAVVVGAPLILMQFFFGLRNEFRELYEVYSLLCLMAFHTTRTAIDRYVSHPVR